ncbi:integrase catalytic domain-containing protein [Trichonephila clavipes]|nr:integrase catalytic domain-containing protein [Trichonephila clavipes]
MHGQCPIGKDSWCYYQRALSCGKKPNEKYKGLSNEVLNTIKPTYLELCTKELLTKCLHGKTQNSNECLNGVIWQRVPKEVFVCLKILKSGALDAVYGYLKRFWEIEVETTEVYSDELKHCNDHFEKTHLRKPDGKFVVEMPFKPDSSEGILGNSKEIASKRLDQLWTRLERDTAMQTLYSEFLNEYEILQHMEEVKEYSDAENGYYIPHHGVLRLSSKTTRLRKSSMLVQKRLVDFH